MCPTRDPELHPARLPTRRPRRVAALAAARPAARPAHGRARGEPARADRARRHARLLGPLPLLARQPPDDRALPREPRRRDPARRLRLDGQERRRPARPPRDPRGAHDAVARPVAPCSTSRRSSLVSRRSSLVARRSRLAWWCRAAPRVVLRRGLGGRHRRVTTGAPATARSSSRAVVPPSSPSSTTTRRNGRAVAPPARGAVLLPIPRGSRGCRRRCAPRCRRS